MALIRVRKLADLILWDFCLSAIMLNPYQKQLLAWRDCVDVVRPEPPTKIVEHQEGHSQQSNDPPENLTTNEDLGAERTKYYSVDSSAVSACAQIWCRLFQAIQSHQKA